VEKEIIRKALTAIFEFSKMDPCEFILVVGEAMINAQNVRSASDTEIENQVERAMEHVTSGLFLQKHTCKSEKKFTQKDADELKRILKGLKII
jgi:hypothetical protein